MRLRLATLNLENLGAERPGFSLSERVAARRSVLLALAADVLCVQEVDGEHRVPHAPRELLALDALLAGTPYASHVRVHTRRPDGSALDVHNLAILSRFPVTAHGQLQNLLVPRHAWRYLGGVSPPADGIPFDRPILHATLDVNGRPLHVVNVHLRAPLATPVPGGKEGRRWTSTAAWAEGFYLSAHKRAAQALEARIHIERLLDVDPGAWIAVCGDFNADVEHTPGRILRAAVTDTGNPELGSRELWSVEEALPPAERYTVLHGGVRLMVDHVLVSRELAARHVATRAHNAGLPDDTAAGPLVGTTHGALGADFSW